MPGGKIWLLPLRRCVYWLWGRCHPGRQGLPDPAGPQPRPGNVADTLPVRRGRRGDTNCRGARGAQRGRGSGGGGGDPRLPALGKQARPANANLYVVFRLELVSGEPRGEGVGTLDADAFSLAKLQEKVGMQSLSMWAIKLAFAPDLGGGFVSHHDAFGLRPGWSLFGLPLLGRQVGAVGFTATR